MTSWTSCPRPHRAEEVTSSGFPGPKDLMVTVFPLLVETMKLLINFIL
jgi:hypothetical protein